MMERIFFSSVNTAVENAAQAYEKYQKMKLSERQKIIDAIKLGLLSQVETIAQMTVEESGMGNLQDKIEKLLLVLNKTPGVEDLKTEVCTTDDGMTLYEFSPYGVVCAVHPCNNPAATLINNTISILAAGNAVVHCPHPRAKKVSGHIVRCMDACIASVSGLTGLVTMLEETTMDSTREIMLHPDVDCVVTTGGDTVFNQAMLSNKKVIGAGPANPPVIVDETADIIKAAADIADSVAFDYNLLCTSEKAIVAVDTIADALILEMERQGAFYINDMEKMMALTLATVDSDLLPKRCLTGRSAAEILEKAGIENRNSPRLIVVETVLEHPFVVNEMLMPLIPIIRVEDFDQAIQVALEIEQGCYHTAVIHSRSIERLNRAAKEMRTAVFVKNGPAYAGIGYKNEGPASFTVASRTGEGTLTARHFARCRRCTLMNSFIIR